MKLRLKELREAQHLSQKDLQKLTGVAANTICHYEQGLAPSINQVEKLARYFEVSPAYLLGYIDDKGKAEATEIVVEKEVEKIVYVEKDIVRLPSYYQPDAAGNVIKWRETKRCLPRRIK